VREVTRTGQQVGTGRFVSGRLVALVENPAIDERGSSGPPTFVVLARPEGLEHTPPTIVIEGVAELVRALRAA
jgi:hypothetical protein